MSTSQEALNLYGLIRKNEGLSYILGIGKSKDQLPVIGRFSPSRIERSSFDISAQWQGKSIVFYYWQNNHWVQTKPEFVNLSDIYLRTPFPKRLMNILHDSCVGMIGIGSMGSKIATGLARTGIGHLKLADPDTFSVENIFRHECNLTDLKRNKARAVKELIWKINPVIKVDAFPCNIFENSRLRDMFFNKTNLIIATTDLVSVQLKVNQESLRRNIPALYAGCYTEAKGGEVFYVLPGETPLCYESLRTGTQQEARQKKYRYTNAQNREEYEGEPGLNAAINFVSDVAEQYAIALLSRHQKCQIAKLINPQRNLIFIGGALGKGFFYLKDKSCFTKPFEFVFPCFTARCSHCEICRNLK